MGTGAILLLITARQVNAEAIYPFEILQIDCFACYHRLATVLYKLVYTAEFANLPDEFAALCSTKSTSTYPGEVFAFLPKSAVIGI